MGLGCSGKDWFQRFVGILGRFEVDFAYWPLNVGLLAAKKGLGHHFLSGACCGDSSCYNATGRASEVLPEKACVFLLLRREAWWWRR